MRLGEKSPGLICCAHYAYYPGAVGAFLFSKTGTKIFFEKLWESRKKIRQRESEKAKSLPGTLKISYTFIRYIPGANSQMKVRQDPPAANGISGTKGGERPRNHSEISGSYGYGHDRLRV